MNINRHNYEEFFLLLADGELPEAEQEMVLQFAQLHPDLDEELQLLMDCRLEADTNNIFPKDKIWKAAEWNIDQPEPMQTQLLGLLDNELSGKEKAATEQEIKTNTITALEWETLNKAKLAADTAAAFPKQQLYKPTIWNIDQPETVQLQMLALLDGELNNSEKEKLEQVIASNELLQVEWMSLQQARVEAEAVIYPNKENLYKQKEIRKIGGWKRWVTAAAAIVAGVGIYMMAPKTSVENIGNDQLASQTIENKVAAEMPASTNSGVAVTADTTSNNANPITKYDAEKTPDDVLTATRTTEPKNTPDQSEATFDVNKNTKGAVAQADSKRKPENKASYTAQNAVEEEPVTLALHNTIKNNVDDLPAATGLIKPKQVHAVPAGLKQTTIFKTASLASDNATEEMEDSDSESDVVYIAGARLNKQKVRGVFRGITRSLGRSFNKSKVEQADEPSSGNL